MGVLQATPAKYALSADALLPFVSCPPSGSTDLTWRGHSIPRCSIAISCRDHERSNLVSIRSVSRSVEVIGDAENFSPLELTSAVIGYPPACVIRRRDSVVIRFAELDAPITIDGDTLRCRSRSLLSAPKHTANGDTPSCEFWSLSIR